MAMNRKRVSKASCPIACFHDPGELACDALIGSLKMSVFRPRLSPARSMHERMRALVCCAAGLCDLKQLAVGLDLATRSAA
jgi:hypothetical protein